MEPDERFLNEAHCRELPEPANQIIAVSDVPAQCGKKLSRELYAVLSHVSVFAQNIKYPVQYLILIRLDQRRHIGKMVVKRTPGHACPFCDLHRCNLLGFLLPAQDFKCRHQIFISLHPHKIILLSVKKCRTQFRTEVHILESVDYIRPHFCITNVFMILPCLCGFVKLEPGLPCAEVQPEVQMQSLLIFLVVVFGKGSSLITTSMMRL